MLGKIQEILTRKLNRKVVEENISRSGLTSTKAILEIGNIARETKEFNRYSSKKPGFVARALAYVYKNI